MNIGLAYKWNQVKIYKKGEIPNLEGFEPISGYLVLAYPNRFLPFSEDLIEDAREVAVWRVALVFDITKEEALEQFEICIIPSLVEGHGQVMFKAKGVK